MRAVWRHALFDVAGDQGVVGEVLWTQTDGREGHIPTVEVRVQACDGGVRLELIPQGHDDDQRHDGPDGRQAEPHKPEQNTW